jgi:hypothetical protein
MQASVTYMQEAFNLNKPWLTQSSYLTYKIHLVGIGNMA